MSDTPITDAAYDAVRAFTNEEQAVDALIELRETSRKLERENAALRELAARMATEMREIDHEFASLQDYDAARKEAQP